MLGFQPGNGRELPRLPSVRPKPTAAAAFARSIPYKKTVSDCVRCTTYREIQKIFCATKRCSRAPTYIQVFLFEGRSAFPNKTRRRSIGPFANCTDFAIQF